MREKRNDCARFRRWLEARLDGVPGGENMASHVSRCAACRTYQTDLLRLHNTLHSWETPPPPRGLRETILARINGNGTRSPREAWVWAQGVAAAIAAAAILVPVVSRFELGLDLSRWSGEMGRVLSGVPEWPSAVPWPEAVPAVPEAPLVLIALAGAVSAAVNLWGARIGLLRTGAIRQGKRS